MASRRTPAKTTPAKRPGLTVVPPVPRDEPTPEPAAEPAPPQAPATEAERPKTLDEAIAGGNYREILEAQLRDIARALPGASGPSRAALHTRMSAIAKELEDMKVAGTGGGSVVADTEDERWDPEAI